MAQSSLSSVVSNLVRASMGSSVAGTVTDDELDRHVAELILKEAKQKAARYLEQGVSAYLPEDENNANAPRANKRFLSAVLRNTDEHNKAVVKAQVVAAQEAQAERWEQESRERKEKAREAVGADRIRRLMGGGLSRRRTDSREDDRERDGKRKLRDRSCEGLDDDATPSRNKRRRSRPRSRAREHGTHRDHERSNKNLIDYDAIDEHRSSGRADSSSRSKRHRSRSREHRRHQDDGRDDAKRDREHQSSRSRRHSRERNGRDSEGRYKDEDKGEENVEDVDFESSDRKRRDKRSREGSPAYDDGRNGGGSSPRGNRHRSRPRSKSREHAHKHRSSRRDGSGRRHHERSQHISQERDGRSSEQRFKHEEKDRDVNMKDLSDDASKASERRSRHDSTVHSRPHSPHSNSVRPVEASGATMSQSAVSREPSSSTPRPPSTIIVNTPTAIATIDSSYKQTTSRRRRQSPQSPTLSEEEDIERLPSRSSRARRVTKQRLSTLPTNPSSSSSRTTPPPNSDTAPPTLSSKMDKYFESSYDPRLDVAPLLTSMPNIPSTGLLNDAEFAGWDAMLDIIRQRREDKAEKKRLIRAGILPDEDNEREKGEKKSKRSSSSRTEIKREVDPWAMSNGLGLMDIEYKKKGAVREWDMGKEGF